MEHQQLVLESLEIASERCGDITAITFQKLFADYPECEDLLSHMDIGVRGKMLNEALRLLMTEDMDDERGYLRYEVKEHGDYGVPPDMYLTFFRVIRDTVKAGLGTEWTDVTSNARDEILAQLSQLVDSLPGHT